MKNYLDKDKTEEVKHIINGFLDDPEFWSLGISDMESYLEKKGFTQIQAGKIEWRLSRLVNTLCKKL